MAKLIDVAVVGASGAVGEAMIRTLERRNVPVRRLVPLASARSAGRTVRFHGEVLPIRELGEASFDGVDVALFSAGASVSKAFAPAAVQAGATVIDNSSAFRMEPGVPLVVPEVNPEALAGHEGIIANPNCSTIQLVLVLKPLEVAAGLERVVVSTYQSASGKGRSGVTELEEQVRDLAAGGEARVSAHPRQLAWNCIPHIDVFLDDGSTREEWKMVVESRKILGLPDLRLHATCVRVPVRQAHSEAVNVELRRPLSPTEARALLESAPGVVVVDEPESESYPTPLDAEGLDPTFVGRIRRDDSVAHGLGLWIVADNLLKGAALNAVQIAELLAPPD